MKELLLLSSIVPTIIMASTGGNCENVCNYQIDNYWTPCIEDNCPQINNMCPTRNATTRICSNDCQMCIDDLYNECGGCTNKYGFDFDKELGPKYKSIAEDMGCNSGVIINPMKEIIIISILVCGVSLYIL